MAEIGLFRREHPGYFKKKKKEKKKIRKKGTRKLLKRCEIDRLTVVKSWKKKGKHLSWFDYERCFVVEGKNVYIN